MNPGRADGQYNDIRTDLSGVSLLNEPFAETDAGHFFYAGADGAQRLDLILHLAPYSPLLVIAGKPGAGKTALVTQCMSRAKDNWRMTAVTARVDMDRDELLREVASGFGLPLNSRDDRRDIYADLIAHLRAVRINAQIPILVLDDAQYLSSTVMDLIRELCGENDAGHILSILLVGTPQLQNLLDSPALSALASRVTHTFEVTPFTEEETGAYIRHRLKAAGAADDGPFNTALIKRIHAGSGGIPARINEMAQRVLANQSLGLRARKTGGDNRGRAGSLKRVVLAIAVLAVVALMVAGPLRTLLSKPAPLAPSVSQNTPIAKLALPLADDGTKEPIDGSAGGKTALAVVPSRQPETGVPGVGETKSDPPSPVAAITPAVSEPAPPVPAVDVPAKAAGGKPQVAEVEVATPTAVKTPVTKAKIAKQPSTDDSALGEDWVRSQPGDHYTLQLMALREEKTARQFIESHHLQGKAAYLPLRHDGEILYTLVYGSYPGYSEAVKAAKELPANWGSPDPWIRSFKRLLGEAGK